MRKIAILGYGTVGSGVVCVLDESKDYIEQKVKDSIEIGYVLDLRDFPGDPIQDKIVHDYQVILDDPEVEVIVEVMGGIHPAYDFVKAALEHGKHAVTSNKQLVEAKGAELGEIARNNHVTFLFEASVAGGIPIIRTLNTALWHEEIKRVYGILNGTTNFILDEMEHKNLTFEEALSRAQANGYAERDPSADVDGLDAARKISILASLTVDHHVPFEEIPTTGIREVTLSDMVAARRLNGTLKLIAGFQIVDGKIYASVEPMFVPKDMPLYPVNSVYNAVMVHSNMLADSMYLGRGAGKHATASAVVADIMASLTGVSQKEMVIWDEDRQKVYDPSDLPNKYIIVFNNGTVLMSDEVTKTEIEKIKAEFTANKIGFHVYKVLQASKEAKD